MKLFETLLLAFGVVLVIIGIYEVMAVGLLHAYSFLMGAIAIFLWFVYRRKSKA
jgi:Flp pilus assembly protein TadB